jgi:TIR domain
MPFSIFISYSHRDRELRKELDKHLSNLKRQNIITAWYDGDISPGTEWGSQIIEHLNTDQIILLLISADFMASDFCYSVEMTQAIARHDANQARVLPIILRPTDWREAPFAKLKLLPTDGKAVTRWPTYDDAFEDIVQGIREAIADLTKQGTPPNPSQAHRG